MNDKQQERTERFTHTGLDCKVVHSRGGHYNGYVRVPDELESVRWTQEYVESTGEIIEADVDVHGGITYGPDSDGWVGFDDAHAQKLVEYKPEETDKEAVKAETKRLAEQIAELHSGDENGV